MEELPRLQEMAFGGQESMMIVPCQQDNRINIEDILTNYQSNSQRNEEKKRGNYSLNSVSTPNRQVPGFSRKTQSTINQADAENDSTLPTTTEQKNSLSTSNSIPLNVSSVAVQSSTRPLATYHQLVTDICSRHSEVVPKNKNKRLHFKCLVCPQESQEYTLLKIMRHLADVHPEVFFADIKSLHAVESMSEATTFRHCCKFILQSSTYRTNPPTKKMEHKKHSEKYTMVCCYCGLTHTIQQRLKLHMFQEHYDALKDKLVAYCRKRGHQHVVPEFSFEPNIANNKTANEIAPSNPDMEFVPKNTGNTPSNAPVIPEKVNPNWVGVVEPVVETGYVVESSLNSPGAMLDTGSYTSNNGARKIPTISSNALSFADNSWNHLPLQSLQYNTYNIASDSKTEITSTNINSQTFDSVVNMELQEPSQNLEYKCRGESVEHEFAQKDKCNTNSNTVEQGNSTCFGFAEQVAGTSFSGDFLNNENVNTLYLTTPQNFHGALLETESYMSNNKEIPNVCLNPASFATVSNYLPLPTATTRNYGDTIFTNTYSQQQHFSTFVEPGNLQHFILPAPPVASEQQQMVPNEVEISGSQPFHAYSFSSSSCSTSTINQVLPLPNVQCIATDQREDQCFDFNALLNQPSCNSITTGSKDDNIIPIDNSNNLESTLPLE